MNLRAALGRWLPQTLFGRSFAALCAALAVTLGVVLLLVQQQQQQLALRAGGVADNARRIVTTLRRLESMSADVRAAEIRLLQLNGLRTPGLAPDILARRAEPESGVRSYEAELHRQLGGQYRISIRLARGPQREAIPLRPGAPQAPYGGMPGNAPEPPTGGASAAGNPASDNPPPPGNTYGGGPPPGSAAGNGGSAGSPPPQPPADNSANNVPPPGNLQWYLIAIRPPGSHTEYLFQVDPPLAAPWLEPRILWQLAVLATLIGLAMYAITRSITRPLADLATAAEAVGGGGQLVLQERGSSELRRATRAFNAMQDRLKRYVDSRTRMLAGMSHDLRTPLTRLRLRAEAIEDPALRARFDHDLDEMQTLVQNTLALFKGLHSQESFTAVDLNALLQEVRDEFLDLYADVRVVGHVRTPLHAQRQTLKRCITNLTENACKYGSRATLRISELPERKSVELRVQDEGQGLPEEEMERVFEPFYRVEASRSRESGGTGLGLAIARDVVQAHGGTIHLQNRAEGGLEAVLVLPITPFGNS
ncbi:MAG: ATP-binding protein [Steroidobacteraceae bacterium]